MEIAVATLPGNWCYMVSTRTGWPRVSVLFLCETASLTVSLQLRVEVRGTVYANPSLGQSLLVGGMLSC